jgi:hypothetical protein
MKTYSSLTEAERAAICTQFDGLKHFATDPQHAAAIVAEQVFRPKTDVAKVNAFAMALTVLVFRGRIKVAS